ncbi:acyl-CoA dehydrogenase family protein, partial [Bacillus velezensis]
MDFLLSKEQQLIQEMVRSFAEKEIEPFAEENDRDSRFPIETF